MPQGSPRAGTDAAPQNARLLTHHRADTDAPFSDRPLGPQAAFRTIDLSLNPSEVYVMGNEKQSGGSDDQSKQPGGSGNFANDRERASEAGKKGGQQSQGGGGSGQANQSGSGRSQQGAVQTDDEDSKESGKEGGESQNQR